MNIYYKDKKILSKNLKFVQRFKDLINIFLKIYRDCFKIILQFLVARLIKNFLFIKVVKT
jgi:hypothetical protein